MSEHINGRIVGGGGFAGNLATNSGSVSGKAGTNTSNALFGSSGKAVLLENVSNMFETGYTTFTADAIFFSAEEYLSSMEHTAFIHSTEVSGKNNQAYYTKLDDAGYISHSTDTRTVGGMLGTYSENITSKAYSDDINYSGLAPKP